jgi:uncharacterized protein (DUF2267 family)
MQPLEAQRLAAELHADVRAAQRDGSIDRRESEFTQRLRELGREVEVWPSELARTFERTAGLLHCASLYGLRDLLGVEGATALQAALGVNADYRPRSTVPGAKNGFNGNGTIEQIRAHNEALELRFRVKSAQRPRQRGSHLDSRRPREGRAACPRQRGSRRSTGTRAGPRSDDDPGGGDSEPDGHLDDPAAGAAR